MGRPFLLQPKPESGTTSFQVLFFFKVVGGPECGYAFLKP